MLQQLNSDCALTSNHTLMKEEGEEEKEKEE